jgi:hypothetical protein
VSARHVMLDLETWGVRPGSVIVAVGAVRFDADEAPTDPFYVNVSAQSCMDAGLSADADTVCWWLRQSDAARARLFEPKPVALAEALEQFTAWWSGATFVWGNGASFDPVLLEAAYRAVGRRAPWRYQDIRDVRTLAHLVPKSVLDGVLSNGVAHDALADAERQARQVQACIRWLRVRQDQAGKVIPS